MEILPTDLRGDALLGALRDGVAGMQRRAAALDADELFPAEDLEWLRGLGALQAPLPRSAGGLGLGTEPAGAGALLDVLRLLGRGNPAVGRLYEAHVNAAALITRYGRPDQAADLQAGRLFGLWVTDAPDAPLRWRDGTLCGAKMPCSGAGHAARALVTMGTDDGTRLAIVDAERARVTPLPGLLHGMRAAANGRVGFDGVALAADAFVGQPDDYLREPDFSCGAWRTTAVTLGLLEAVVEELRMQLVARRHNLAVPQQERFGQAWIAMETARLWTGHAAQVAEIATGPVPDKVATVNLARIAVETACLDALRLAQRSLGLGAFLRTNPLERMARDLATYLRQPAPDAVLTEAAAHLLGKP